MLKDNRQQASDINSWSFIGDYGRKNESIEKASLREIEKETGLKLESVKFLTTLISDNKRKFIYHAILTSDNLNNIKRDEGQNLDFFRLPEVEKLPMEKFTKIFLSDHKEILEQILKN